jgi:hypothetical protein
VRRTKPCEQGFTRDSVAPALVLHLLRFASLRLFRVDIPAHSQAPLRPGIASIPRASCGHGFPTPALTSSPRHTLVRPVVSRCDSHHKTALSPAKTSPRNEDQHVRLAAASLTLERHCASLGTRLRRTYYFSRAGPTRSARVPPPPRSIDHWRCNGEHARRHAHGLLLDGGAKDAIAIRPLSGTQDGVCVSTVSIVGCGGDLPERAWADTAPWLRRYAVTLRGRSTRRQCDRAP